MLKDRVKELAAGGNYAARVTLMPDGTPQSQMTWVDHDGEHLIVNTERERQVFRNIERDPRITLMILAGPWEYCEVRGTVVEVIGGGEARAHIDHLARRYTGADYANPVGPSGRVMLRIRPDRQNVFGE